MQQLYTNANVLTMDDRKKKAQAVLVSDGIIRAVGSVSEMQIYQTPDTQTIDLKGHTLLPAFLDPHSHITSFATTLDLVQLSDTVSFGEITQKLREFVQQNSLAPGAFVIGFGYDHNHLAEHRHPTKELLDQALPGYPILLAHTSGHMGVANSLALSAMGVSETTEPPQGGKIGRNPDGSLSGYLEETAFTQLAQAGPRPSLEQVFRNFSRAQDIYLSYGIATAQDGLTNLPEIQLLDALATQHALKMDIVGYADLSKNPNLLLKYPEYVGKYQNHLRLGGYKIFLDGSPQGRTAWLSAPYEDAADGYCGYPTYPDEQVEQFIETALLENFQLLVHCNGDAAAQQYLDCYQRALKKTGSVHKLRPVMVHAQLLRPDQLPVLHRLGMIASFFTAHTYYWGDTHIQNLGMDRARRISPAASAQKEGVCYTFHQDTPVVPCDMMHTLWAAVNRVTKSGVALGEEERLSPYDALKGITIHAAYQYFEEDQKGSIAAGKRADFVILEQDPLSCDPMAIKDIPVLSTICEGKTLYQR